MKTKIIVVAGPTASGKTYLGIQLAKALNGEIICADSMQVYKNMPIATAAPTKEEQNEANHHLNEIISPSTPFSVADYCKLAKEETESILQKGKTPIIVGGTGLFIDSFVKNISFTKSDTDFELRNNLMARDIDSLYDELCTVDLKTAEKIHKNNKNRVVRALELFYTTGKTKTLQDIESTKNESPYDVLYFVIDYSIRKQLYDRINNRVDIMIKNGLVDEAKAVLECKTKTAAQAIGHKELIPYINGECSLNTAVEKLKQQTRRYAKRQMTWFRKNQNAVVLDASSMTQDELVNTAINKAKDFLYVKDIKTKS